MKNTQNEQDDIAQIIDCYFICDRCGKECDRGEIRGCGRRMIKLCSGCIKEIEEDGVE